MKQKIYEAYTKTILEEEKVPTSVYRFCKNIGIEESEFYKHFASLEHLKGQIFCQFFDNALSLIQKEKDMFLKRLKRNFFLFILHSLKSYS